MRTAFAIGVETLLTKIAVKREVPKHGAVTGADRGELYKHLQDQVRRLDGLRRDGDERI